MGWKFLAVLLGALTALWGSGIHPTSARDAFRAFADHQADTFTASDPDGG
jgi:hypothetical protein